MSCFIEPSRLPEKLQYSQMLLFAIRLKNPRRPGLFSPPLPRQYHRWVETRWPSSQADYFATPSLHTPPLSPPAVHLPLPRRPAFRFTPVFHHIYEILHVSSSRSPTQGFEPVCEHKRAHKSSMAGPEEGTFFRKEPNCWTMPRLSSLSWMICQNSCLWVINYKQGLPVMGLDEKRVHW